MTIGCGLHHDQQQNKKGHPDGGGVDKKSALRLTVPRTKYKLHFRKGKNKKRHLLIFIILKESSQNKTTTHQNTKITKHILARAQIHANIEILITYT